MRVLETKFHEIKKRYFYLGTYTCLGAAIM